MIEYFIDNLTEIWGPFRLFKSHFFLAIFGFTFSAILTFFILPKYWDHLARDGGRAHAIGAKDSIGKPLGAGVLMVGVIILVTLFFCPTNSTILMILPIIGIASIIGFIDDKSGGLSEKTLGFTDLVISIVVTLILFGINSTTIWLPFITQTFEVPFWINLPLCTGIIWLSINSLNCNDGVDGLSGSLSLISILIICILFYTVIGHVENSSYLLVPYNSIATLWTVFGFIVSGSIFAYLWYNFPPSQVLMGDAGSRPLGLIIGILVCVSQNPLFLIVFTSVILINGASGLLKLAVIRLFKINFLSNIRFPLHDYVRKDLKWSNFQVLGRFLQIHILLIIILLILTLKIR